ncbi:nitric oxide-associated protein 1 [Etheostoma cragini]|uniref:nitric oxide-associated protein 1 n=1 Tax=Etheostoma cragini TaxID=417921 RepID=UPI00155F2586|nr:nitric oxide-associated protein 1 [Etheostoma cragini]
MKQFPPLVPQEFSLEGGGYLQAAADITLSSAGWVAVTAAAGDQLLLRVHGPAGVVYSLRTPPLLPHLVALKGERIRKSPAYRTVGGASRGGGGLALQGKQKKKRA